MKVLLASPESNVWSSRKHIPLGLGYLAAVLRENGHRVGIFDAAIEDESLELFQQACANVVPEGVPPALRLFGAGCVLAAGWVFVRVMRRVLTLGPDTEPHRRRASCRPG